MIRLIASIAWIRSDGVRDSQNAVSSDGPCRDVTLIARRSRVRSAKSLMVEMVSPRRPGVKRAPYRYAGSQLPWRSISSSHIATIRSTGSSAAVWGSSIAAW